MQKKELLAIFFLALLIRLSFVLTIPKDGFLPYEDQIIHHQLAQNVLAGNGLAFPSSLYYPPEDAEEWIKERFALWRRLGGLWGVIPPDKPQTSFPPLHPLYLASLYWLFGPLPLASRIAQSVLGAFTCIFIALLGNLIFDRKVGLGSGLVMAFYPSLVYFTGIILTETLYIFLLTLAILLFYKLEKHSSYLVAAIFGLTFGLTFLTRDSILLVFPFFLCWSAYRKWFEYKNFFLSKSEKQITNRNFQKIFWVIKYPLISAFVFMLVLTPWVFRNYLIYQEIIITPTKGGWNLWERNNYRLNPQFLEFEHPELKPAFKNLLKIPIQQIHHPELLEYPPFTDETEPERDRILKDYAIRFLKANPKIYFQLCKVRVWELLRIQSPNEKSTIIKLLNWLSYGIFGPLGFLGLCISLKKWSQTMPLFILVLYTIALHILVSAEPRYRLPIEPFLIIFAAWFILSVFDYLKKEFIVLKYKHV